MEQDDRDESDILSDADETEAKSFEDYLNRKVEKCIADQPASEMGLTPSTEELTTESKGNLKRRATDVDVENVADDSSNGSFSNTLEESDRRNALRAARVAAESAEVERVRAALVESNARNEKLAKMTLEERAAYLHEEAIKAGQAESETIDNTIVSPDLSEHVTREELRHHPITGHYIVEHSEALSWDDECKSVYFGTFEIGSADLDTISYDELKARTEAVILQTYKLERQIQLAKAQQAGLSPVKFLLLQHLNVRDREAMAELDVKERAKASRTPKKPKATGISKASKSGKTEAEKGVDKLKGLLFAKVDIMQMMKTQGKLDAKLQSYIDALFGDSTDKEQE